MYKVLKTKKDLGHSMVKFQKISTLSALIGILISLLIVFGCSAGEIQNMIYVEGGTFQMGSDN